MCYDDLMYAPEEDFYMGELYDDQPWGFDLVSFHYMLEFGIVGLFASIAFMLVLF
jgi:hypothetical protein